jgi:hypothetical protein
MPVKDYRSTRRARAVTSASASPHLWQLRPLTDFGNQAFPVTPSCYCLLYTPRVLCHAGAMQKDFPGWHRQKAQLHAQHQTPTFQEREIWWCSVGVNIGHEMDGKRFRRKFLCVDALG